MSYDIDKVREHLESGGTVVVGNLWYFTKTDMECEETREGEPYVCCEDHFSEIGDALESIHYFSDNGELEIDFI